MSTISDILTAIKTAVYGRDVRDSIHDGIAQCYSNVTAGKTLADTAATNANAKATLADTAAANANTKAILAETKATLAGDKAALADTAANNANTKATLAETAASNANTKAALAGDKAALADTAANNANTKAALAETAASNANTKAALADTKAALAGDKAGLAEIAAANADAKAALADIAAASADGQAANANTKAALADTAASNAASNAALAETAAAKADSSAANADGKAALADTAANNANERANAANAAAINADSAATNANGAAQNANRIGNMTVSYENVGPSASGEVTLSEAGDRKNLHFKLRQGPQGLAYLIKGHAYATVGDLDSAIANPAMGDQYNVGLSAPYNVYRWTGEEWEDQGIVSGNDQGTLNRIDDLEAAAAGLASAKVDKEAGKGLSSCDYTVPEKLKLSTLRQARDFTPYFPVSGWIGSRPYTQTVALPGILSADIPVADVLLSANEEDALKEIEEYAKVHKVVTADGSITATCLKEKPTVNLTIALKVV